MKIWQNFLARPFYAFVELCIWPHENMFDILIYKSFDSNVNGLLKRTTTVYLIPFISSLIPINTYNFVYIHNTCSCSYIFMCTYSEKMIISLIFLSQICMALNVPWSSYLAKTETRNSCIYSLTWNMLLILPHFKLCY